MPEFIIHIGPHKTGTTYLQLSFKARRAALEARGTLLPATWEFAPGNPSHLLLAQRLKSGQADGLAAEFASLIASGASRILISAEDLSTLDIAALEVLRTLLAGHPARFVFYVRRWSELTPSSWQESVKHGQTWSLPDFVLMAMQNAGHSRLLNFDHKLSKFASVFGAASLSLVGYSELRDRSIDLFQHFAAHFLDWPDAGPGDAPKQANASRGVADSEILRVLNLMARRAGIPVDRMRRGFDALPDRACLAPVAEAIAAHIQTLRFNDSWPQLIALHATLIERYGDRMVPPLRPRQMFRPQNKELPFANPAYMLEPGVGETLRAVYERASAG